jgi:hypothetical protein
MFRPASHQRASSIQNTRVTRDRHNGVVACSPFADVARSLPVAETIAESVPRSVAPSRVRPRREAMTSRSSMPAQRRHMRHQHQRVGRMVGALSAQLPKQATC